MPEGTTEYWMVLMKATQPEDSPTSLVPGEQAPQKKRNTLCLEMLYQACT